MCVPDDDSLFTPHREGRCLIEQHHESVRGPLRQHARVHGLFAVWMMFGVIGIPITETLGLNRPSSACSRRRRCSPGR